MYELDPTDSVFEGKPLKSIYVVLNDFGRWVFVEPDPNVKYPEFAEMEMTYGFDALQFGKWNYADADEVPSYLAQLLEKKQKKFQNSKLIKDKNKKAEILGIMPWEINRGSRRYNESVSTIQEKFNEGVIDSAQILDLARVKAKNRQGLPENKLLLQLFSTDKKVPGYEAVIDSRNASDITQFLQEAGLMMTEKDAQKAMVKADQARVAEDIDSEEVSNAELERALRERFFYTEAEADAIAQQGRKKLIETIKDEALSAEVRAEMGEGSRIRGAGAIGKTEIMPRQKSGTSTVDNAAKRQVIVDLIEESGVEQQGELKIIITDKTSEWGVKEVEGKELPGLFEIKDGIQTAYFALDNIVNEEDAARTFVHEVGIHYGLPRTMGDKQYQDFLSNVAEAFPKEVAKFENTEEFIADYAETVGTNSFFDKIAEAFVKAMRFVSFGKWFDKMTKVELRSFIRDAVKNLGAKSARLVQTDRVMERKKVKDEDYRHLSDAGRDSMRAVYVDTPSKYSFSNIKNTIKTKFVSSVFDSLKPVESKLGKDEYILTRLARRGEGVMTAVLEYGGIKVIKDKLTDPNKSYLSLDIDMKKQSLFDILKPLGSDAERKQFFAWLSFKRADQLKGEDRENYFTNEQIRAGLAELDKGMVKDAVTGKLTDRASLYQRISKGYGDWNTDIVNVAVEMGLLRRQQAEDWEKQFYVPFFREFEDAMGEQQFVGPVNYRGLVNAQTVKKLKGSPDPIHDPFDNILLNSLHLIDASLKNYAAVNAIESATKIIDPATGDFIAKKVTNSTKNSVKVHVNGKERNYIISDALLLEALSSQHYKDINFPGMDFATKAKRMFTWGTTIGMPFKVRNAIRDTVSTAGVTDVGYNIFDNFFGGLGRLKDREMKARMLVNGAYIQFGHLSSGNADFARKTLEKNLDQKYILNNPSAQDNFEGAWRKYGRMARQILNRYEDWGNELENANRASLFQKEAAKRGSNLLAAYHARDILDFSLSGSSSTVRMFNQLLPFTNARLQGLYKMGRAINDQPQIFWTVGSAVMLASLLNYLTYKDDEDWKSREEWDKDTYFWFKVPGTETAFRIPTPHEFGLMGNIAWRSYAAVFDEDPIHRHLYAERMMALLGHELALDPTPQLIKPIKEIMTDKVAFTGRHIEGPALQRLSPTERKRLWTTQTAIGASKALNQVPWEKVQLSPVQVEHVIKGYFGWIGQMGLFISDLMVRGVGDYPEQPGRRLNEWPVARDFFQTTPIKNTTYGNIFYEQLKEIEQAHADVQLYKRVGDFERANELAEEHREKLYLRKILNRKQDIVQDLNNRIKKMQASSLYTPEHKRIEIDRLEQLRNSIMREVVRSIIVPAA